MPNLPWDIIIPLATLYFFLAVLIGKTIGAADKPAKPRPAVIAAANRGRRKA